MAVAQLKRSQRDRLGLALARRPWIALEVALAAVIAFLNVLMPTFLLLALGTVSLGLRRKSWLDLGLRRPTSWRNTVVLGALLACATTAFSLWVARPGIEALTGQVQDFSQFQEIQGNWGMLLIWLAVSWILAAFGEELAFRGYLLNRSLDLFGNRWAGLAAALLLNASAFGVLHAYQGLGGILNTALDAALFAGIYLAGRRNLWLTILVHGIGNSLGMIAMYFGWFGLL